MHALLQHGHHLLGRHLQACHLLGRRLPVDHPLDSNDVVSCMMFSVVLAFYAHLSHVCKAHTPGLLWRQALLHSLACFHSEWFMLNLM